MLLTVLQVAAAVQGGVGHQQQPSLHVRAQRKGDLFSFLQTLLLRGESSEEPNFFPFINVSTDARLALGAAT